MVVDSREHEDLTLFVPTVRNAMRVRLLKALPRRTKANRTAT